MLNHSQIKFQKFTKKEKKIPIVKICDGIIVCAGWWYHFRKGIYTKNNCVRLYRSPSVFLWITFIEVLHHKDLYFTRVCDVWSDYHTRWTIQWPSSADKRYTVYLVWVMLLKEWVKGTFGHWCFQTFILKFQFSSFVFRLVAEIRCSVVYSDELWSNHA